MKRSFFYLTILAGILLFSLPGSAQEKRLTEASPKPPLLTGKQLQSDKISNAQPVVSPVIAEKDLGATVQNTKVSSLPPKPVKGNDDAKLTQANNNELRPMDTTSHPVPPVIKETTVYPEIIDVAPKLPVLTSPVVTPVSKQVTPDTQVPPKQRIQ